MEITKTMSLNAFVDYVGVPAALKLRALDRLKLAEFEQVTPADAGLAQTIIQDMVQAEERVEQKAAIVLGGAIRRSAAAAPTCKRCGATMRGPVLSAGNIAVYFCENDRVSQPVEG